MPEDPWGRQYQYRYPGQHNKDRPDIWSMGKDGQDGTADDIGNWSNEEPAAK
jgi:general secretion pathway protein G